MTSTFIKSFNKHDYFQRFLVASLASQICDLVVDDACARRLGVLDKPLELLVGAVAFGKLVVGDYVIVSLLYVGKTGRVIEGEGFQGIHAYDFIAGCQFGLGDVDLGLGHGVEVVHLEGRIVFEPRIVGCRIEVIGVVGFKQAVVKSHEASVVKLVLEHAHLVDLLLLVGYDFVMHGHDGVDALEGRHRFRGILFLVVDAAGTACGYDAERSPYVASAWPGMPIQTVSNKS